MKTNLFRQLIDRTRVHWRTQWKSHLRTIALVGVILICVQSWQTRDVPIGTAPDVDLLLLLPDGSSTKFSPQEWRAQHPGQPVALHFWADWCPICRTEENSITRLASDWPVLTVAMQSGSADNVRKVLQKRELTWNAGVDESGHATRAFGFKAVPAFVVVDAQGQVRAPTTGYTTEIGMRLRLWWASLTTA